MTLVLFLVTLSILVLVHEFGHFIVARKNGIRVEEFGLGLPPRIFGKKFGETLYSLNALPFGGFVRLTGEDVIDDANASSEKTADLKPNTPTMDPRSFAAKSPLRRLSVLVAGVFMNLVLAVVLFYVYLFANGLKTDYMPLFFEYKFRFGTEHVINTVITDIAKDSPADKAGIKAGEVIKAINGKEVTSIADIRLANAIGLGEEIIYTLKDIQAVTGGDNSGSVDGSSIREVTVAPIIDNKGNAIVGVYLGKVVYVSYDSPLEKAFAGFLQAYNVTSYSLNGMRNLIALSVATHDIQPVSEGVSGPVGIYNVVGGILKYSGNKVFLDLLNFVALMSVSLAFVNILPFPALDGGRALFVLIEFVFRKKINPYIEAQIHRFGMLVLLGLIVVITFKDIFVK